MRIETQTIPIVIPINRKIIPIIEIKKELPKRKFLDIYKPKKDTGNLIDIVV